MSKVRPSLRPVIGLGMLAAALVLALPTAASAQTGTFTASPTSGAAGATVTLTSVTPCTLPAGVTGSPLVRVTLTRGSTRLGSAEIPVRADGSWSGSLHVGSNASAGTAQLSGFCFASPQAEGALLE